MLPSVRGRGRSPPPQPPGAAVYRGGVRLAAVRVLRGINKIEGEKKGMVMGWIMKRLAKEQDPRVRREITDLLVRNFGARAR